MDKHILSIKFAESEHRYVSGASIEFFPGCTIDALVEEVLEPLLTIMGYHPDTIAGLFGEEEDAQEVLEKLRQ